MALEDYLEPEVAVAAAVTAVIFSPRARKMVRKGLVYSVAGVLRAGDMAKTFVGSVKQGAQETASPVTPSTAPSSKAEAAPAASPASNATHRRTSSRASAEGAGD
jgi:hypothetical protein